jgi:membrane-bound serine protease (ClpP class)
MAMLLSEGSHPVLAAAFLAAGLVLIAAEFFLPTVIFGFIGAVVSFAGIYLSAEQGLVTCAIYATIFVVGLGLEFVAFRRILPHTPMGREMTNRTHGGVSAVPTTADYSRYVGRSARATTVLAPSGTVEIDGNLLEAFSLDGFVERGATLVVTEAGTGRVTVRLSRPNL